LPMKNESSTTPRHCIPWSQVVLVLELQCGFSRINQQL
jgi:hypothetical protein